jgi:hypothetical protein
LKYLDFKNGQGVRFLTQFDQAYLPINNDELFYTYQGLTSDGKYYVAAVLPVNAADLPADGTVTDELKAGDFGANFMLYLEQVVKQLESQPATSFTPDLGKLDAMMASLEVK